jgi:hypothetical protein
MVVEVVLKLAEVVVVEAKVLAEQQELMVVLEQHLDLAVVVAVLVQQVLLVQAVLVA